MLTIQAAVDRAGDEQLTPISLAVKAADARKADMMKTVMELAWKVSVIDVQQVLASACRKVLNDNGVPKDDRLKRAKALREVGSIFVTQAKASGHTKTWQEELAKHMGDIH